MLTFTIFNSVPCLCNSSKYFNCDKYTSHTIEDEYHPIYAFYVDDDTSDGSSNGYDNGSGDDMISVKVTINIIINIECIYRVIFIFDRMWSVFIADEVFRTVTKAG